MGTRAPMKLCTLKDSSCLYQNLDQDALRRRPFVLPLPGLPLQAAWTVTQRAAAVSASPHVSHAFVKGSCPCQDLFSQYTFTVPVAGCLLPCMYLRWWPTACPATPDQLQSDQTSKLLCDLMSWTTPSPMVPDPLPIFPSLGILCQPYRYHKEFPYILQLLLYHS